jgi:hypothetical protein
MLKIIPIGLTIQVIVQEVENLEAYGFTLILINHPITPATIVSKDKKRIIFN